MAASSEDRNKCVFCRIADGKENTELLYQDDKIVAFRDIKPAAPHHYLVITREHITNVKSLKSEQADLVETFVGIGKKVLAEKGGDVETARFGFHWPPFTMISHIHLHVIAPQNSMSFLGRTMFKPNSWWFVTAEYVLKRLRPPL